MDPNAPMTPRDVALAVWAMAVGLAEPWVIIVPVWLLIDRYRDRKASRQAQARLQAWEAAHPHEPEDEHARLARIKDQLWLESLAPHVRAHILRQRLEDAERDAMARAILEAERRADQNGGARGCIFRGCLPPNPWERCHSIHMKPATQST